MTELMEALRTFLVDEGYWAVVISVVSVGGGGYLLRKARLLMTTIIGQLPLLVKDIMLKSLNVDEVTAVRWTKEIEDSKVARVLLLEKELADIELKLGSPLLTDKQKEAYDILKQKVLVYLADLGQEVVDEAINAIENINQ